MIRKGLNDLARGERTVESLLIQIGWPRLRLSGAPVQTLPRDINADHKLYDLLCESHGPEAHSQYNSFVRELVSFERALEHRHSARERMKAQG